MAELVHLRMEYTLQELEEMERIKLFTTAEIKQIIKKRTNFEYKLRKRLKKKEDFLNYIQYEINLLDLIKERRNRLLIDVKKVEIDVSVAHRINRLFKNTISHFQEDEKIWLDQIEFAKKMHWTNLIDILYKRLLQVHAKKPALWIKAAEWLVTFNEQYDRARELLKKSLLHNPTSEVLWLKLFNVELQFSSIMMKKKELLEAHSATENVEDDDPTLNGNDANSVYDKAVESIEDPEFALSFIEICMKFDFGERHIEHIFDDVRKRFAEEEVVLDAIAKKPLLHQEKLVQQGKEIGKSKKTTMKEILNEVKNSYEEIIKNVSSERMWDFYIAHVLSLRDCAKENKRAQVQAQCVDVMEKAATADCLSLSYFPLWLDCLVEAGQKERCLAESLKAARKWKTVELWTKCFTHHIREMQDEGRIHSLLTEALDSVEEKDSLPLWKLGIEWLSLSSSERLMDLFEKGIKCEREVSVPLKEMYLETCAVWKGVKAARKMYQKFKKSGSLPSEVVKKMIVIESAQLNTPIERLRKYLEDGVREFGSTNPGIWLDYMKLETDHKEGNPAECSAIFWRAKKCLVPEALKDFQVLAVNFATR